MSADLERSLEPSSLPQPTLGRGVVFRFGFAYWTLFCLYVVVTNTDAFDWFLAPVSRAFGAFGVWIATTFLGVTREIGGNANGSGDKVSDWSLLLFIAVAALVATVVWTAVDRRRARDAWLREVLRVMVRYTLAFSVLGYGVSKVFFGQFPPPSPGRLLQPYGESSPMGLMWTFMGASPAYVFFSGLSETVGAVLLLFRRTATLGALLLAIVMTNVVLLNFCYDVPVKICSAHYLAMCILLLLPDLGRLANVLVLNRVAQPVARDLVLRKRWMRVTRRVLKYGVIAMVMFVTFKGSVTRYLENDGPRSWYDGYWLVDSFSRDGQVVPAIPSEPARWQRVRFQRRGDNLWVRWRFMGDAMGYSDLYDVKVDEAARTFTFTFNPTMNATKQAKPGLGVVVLTYVRIDDAHFKLEGVVGGDHLSVVVSRMEPGKSLLVSRGFHWINDVPFNR
jgi:hypothetical protein